MKRIGIISQARMGSSRLPGKVLKTVKGKTLLEYHVERLRQSGIPLFIATTTEAEDDVLEAFCRKNDLTFYRGSQNHVLSRFLKVVDAEKLDVVIRVTSDCPLIDPILIRKAVDRYLALDDDRIYLSNAVTRTFARGFDFEVFSANLLREALEKDPSQASTEHVTPYLYSGKDPSIKLMAEVQAVDHSFLRVTVDEPSDFELVSALIEKFSAENLNASEIEELLLRHPELTNLNQSVVQTKL
jgi:spore coat polysaccharide biosynthesis protein SpsF